MLLLIGVLLAVFVLPSPWGLVAVVVGGVIDVGESVGLMWYSKRRKAAVGAQTLIGRQAIAVGDLWPEGQVKIDGEVWKARSPGGVTTGTAVVVRGLDGLTLEVEPAGIGERDEPDEQLEPDDSAT